MKNVIQQYGRIVSVSDLNSLKSIILPLICLTLSYSHLVILFAILVSSLITICNMHNITLLFLNHAFIFAGLLILQYLYCFSTISNTYLVLPIVLTIVFIISIDRVLAILFTTTLAIANTNTK